MNYTAFIPTFNSSSTLNFAIESIKNQIIKPQRVIVIDSGSTDNTCELAKNLGVEVFEPKHWNLEFLGLAKARNRILELIDTEFLLSIDSDVELMPNFVQNIANEYEKHPHIAGCGGKLIDLHRSRLGDKYRAVILMRDLYTPLCTKNEKFVDWLSGSQNIYRVSALKDVGLKLNNSEFRPFNDELNTNYEDIDIGNKLNGCGYKLFYNPKIVSHHHQKDSVVSAINRHFRYRINEHIFANNLTEFDRYENKIDANIKEFENALNLVLEKNRFALLYPVFLLAIHLFLADTKYASGDIKDAIFNSFAKYSQNSYLQNALKSVNLEQNFTKNSKNYTKLDSFLDSLLNFKYFPKELLDSSYSYFINEQNLDFKNVRISFFDKNYNKTNYTICTKFEDYNDDELFFELKGLSL